VVGQVDGRPAVEAGIARGLRHEVGVDDRLELVRQAACG
jgi:hypothetical protein